MPLTPSGITMSTSMQIERLFCFKNFQRSAEIGRQRHVVAFAVQHLTESLTERPVILDHKDVSLCRRSALWEGRSRPWSSRTHHVSERLSLGWQALAAQESRCIYFREPAARSAAHYHSPLQG